MTKQAGILRELDDILDELAMIRRVQEDMRLVCLDYFESRPHGLKVKHVDGWAQRGKSKLKRLEHDATMIRKSVSTY